MSSQNIVAVFDFDGTITSIDTFRDFIIWHRGPFRFWGCILITSPLIAFYLLGIIGNNVPKHAFFRLLYRNYSASAFQAACQDYARRRLPSLIRPKALARIHYHLRSGHRLFIASASLRDWIEPWASSTGFEYVIATQALTHSDKLTGDFSDVCFYGSLKVARLNELGILQKNTILYAYGDSKGDRELLAIADHKSYREF